LGYQITPTDGLQPPLTTIVEPVEKVPKQILGRDAEKSDLIECATINDLMPGKGSSDPRKQPLNRGKGVFLQARYALNIQLILIIISL
jgi:hypothetical protein